ncbi:MAG TPA: DUF1214 domain-containing protein [Myxococcota bacterium]|nr:DUF1214 domain-containing protein [Myxococcota bacterium]
MIRSNSCPFPSPSTLRLLGRRRLLAQSVAFGLAIGLASTLGGCAGSGPSEAVDIDPEAAQRLERHRALASAHAFEQLQQTLDEQAELILADARDEREAWEGLRALLRVLAMSIDTSLDGNPKAPHFTRMDTNIRKVGGDNPDGEYDHVVLDNRWDYVIRGNLGTVRHLSFTILGPRTEGRSGAIAYLNERTLGATEEGDFEIHLTKTPVDHRNWVDTSGGISSILVRQYIGDRQAEILARYEIEVVGREPFVGIPYSTDEEVAKALAATAYSTRFMTTMHRTVLPKLWDSPNVFVRANSGDFGADISSNDNLYMMAAYQVDPDEALVIEGDPLDVRYWNLAVESRWHETVDYQTRRTHRTLDDSVVDADGKLRFVLAHGPTPHPNWLDTGGNREGFLTFRWVGERDNVAAVPVVLRVPRGDVERVLAERRGEAP